MRTAALPFLLAAALVAAPAAWAQDSNSTSPATASTSAPPASSDAANPKLVVSQVKLDGGWRASKFIGSAVYDDQNEKIGSVDDLIMQGTDKVAVVVVSVGGFLGIGNKLVAVPFDHLHWDPAGKDSKIVMAGASKDTLNTMPSFTYTGT